MLVDRNLRDEILHIIVRVALLHDCRAGESQLVTFCGHDRLGDEAAQDVGEAKGDKHRHVEKWKEFAPGGGVLAVEGAERAGLEHNGSTLLEIAGRVVGEAVDGIDIGILVGEALPNSDAAIRGRDVFFQIEFRSDQIERQPARPDGLRGEELVDVHKSPTAWHAVEGSVEAGKSPTRLGNVIVIGVDDHIRAAFDGVQIAEHFAAVMVEGKMARQRVRGFFLVFDGEKFDAFASPAGGSFFVADHNHAVAGELRESPHGLGGREDGGDDDGFFQSESLYWRNVIL